MTYSRLVTRQRLNKSGKPLGEITVLQTSPRKYIHIWREGEYLYTQPYEESEIIQGA